MNSRTETLMDGEMSFPVLTPNSSEVIHGGNEDQENQETLLNGQLTSDRNSDINMNRYSTLKTMAQGLMDVALLTSNISQLKYLLLIGPDENPLFYLLLVLITLSVILQVSCGMCILFLGNMDINKPENQRRADDLNKWVTGQIFLVSVLNIVISTLGIENIINRNPMKPLPIPSD